MKKVLSLLLLVSVSLQSLFVISPDVFASNFEIERNDSEYYATNINLNKYTTGYLSNVEDVDYYKFTLSKPGKIRLYFEHPYIDNEETFWKIKVYKKDSGTVFTYHSYGVDYEGDYSNYVGVSSGTYYITISSYYNGWATTYHSDVDYRLMIDYIASDVYEYEADNDYYETGKRIALNTSYYGNMFWAPYSWSDSYEDNIDWYKIVLQAPGIYTLNFNTKYMNSSDWSYEIKNDDGVTVTYGDLSTPRDSVKLSLPRGFVYIGFKKDYVYGCPEYNFNLIPHIAAPKLSNVLNTVNGVKVTWESVSGADKYRVYRKTQGGSWERVGDTTSRSMVDKKATSGNTYYYTVKAFSGSVAGSYNKKGIPIRYVATPTLNKIENATTSVKVTWSKVRGADGYAVYRKKADATNWTRIATIKNGSTTSYKDFNVSSCQNYTYTVRAYDGNVYSSYVSSGISIKYLSTPKLTKATSSKSGITINWNKVTGATGYTIYRKTGNGSWQALGKTTTNSKVTYIDKTAKKGVTYTYTVRATNGSNRSYYNRTGLTIKDKY